MARPAKSTAVKTGAITKEEESMRAEREKAITGSSDNLDPPEYLTDKQKSVFEFIKSNLSESGILGNLDIAVLSNASIAIERLQAIETMINDDPELLRDNKIMASQDRYFRQFARYCNELCLSPQSRAKLALTSTQTEMSKKPKTIMDVLSSDE